MRNVQGRPPLYAHDRQVSVLISDADHRALLNLVEYKRTAEPDFTLPDLLRTFIERGLLLEGKPGKARPVSPRADRVRRLHAIARQATDLAREVAETSKRDGKVA